MLNIIYLKYSEKSKSRRRMILVIISVFKVFKFDAESISFFDELSIKKLWTD